MQIYQLKITLKGSRPPVWRRILVQPEITFYQLHRIIQIAMDWDDFHLHQFVCRAPEGRRSHAETAAYDLFTAPSWQSISASMARRDEAYIGDPEQLAEIWEPSLSYNEHEEKLSDWLTREKERCTYTYDFGDDWEHEILLEKIVPADPKIRYPLCIKAKRVAPLEDSGGIWNYEPADEGKTDEEIVREINKYLQAESEHFHPAKEIENKSGRTGSQTDILEPTLEDWKNLYLAAIRFKELKSWQWMDNDDIFAVQDTETGYTGYCSVMGAAGELFGLAVYVGDRGLETLIKVLSEDITDEELLDQRSLLLTFEDREALDKTDYEVIRSLGLRFRGHNQWPLFRSYSPGQFPWYFDKTEVSFMTKVLDQAVDVCLKVKENPKFLWGETVQDIFTRRSVNGEHSEVDWEDTWLKLVSVPEVSEIPSLQVNELQLHRIRSYKIAQISVEFDYLYFPQAIQDRADARPYYAYAGLWVDHQNGLILDAEIVTREEHKIRFQEKLLQMIQKHGWKPQTILVQKENAYNVLSPVTEKLGINLLLVPELTAVNQAMEDLFHNIRSF